MDILKSVGNFVLEHRAIAITTVLLVIFAALNWKVFKQAVINLMIDAEQHAKEYLLNAGKDKEEWVVSEAYALLPVWLKFIPKKTMHAIVHYLFVKAKDFIDNGKFDNSYKDPDKTPMEW